MLRTLQVRLQKSRGGVTIAVCWTIVALVVACAPDDQGVGKSLSRRPVNDLKLSSGNEVTRVEVDKLDDGRMYFRYESKHVSNSCAQLNEVRELWKSHVLSQPEAATASAITLDPTDPSGRSQTYRYLKQDEVWTERFSTKCDG